MISINEITEKQGILFSLAPYSEGVKALKRKSDLTDFVFSNLRLYGSSLTIEGVRLILDGGTIPDAPVFEHRLCEAHRTVLSGFESKISMGIEVDSFVLNEFCMTLTGSDLPPYRDGSPLLYHLDFVPNDDEKISADLAKAFSVIKRDERDGRFNEGQCADPFIKAAALHNAIVKVYPYTEGFTELSARTAMQYTLVKGGFFPVNLGISETEYNEIIAESIKSDEAEKFADIIKIATFKKLHYLIDAVERGL